MIRWTLILLSVVSTFAFDPSDISGLKLRYDVNALSSTDGTLVTTLTDSSGNGYDAIAPGAGTGWTNDVRELNNQGYLQFKQVTSFTATHPTWTQPLTIFMVARPHTVAGTTYWLMSGGNTIGQYPAKTISMESGSTCNSVPYNGTDWVIYEFQFNAGLSAMWTNGVLAQVGCNPGTGSQTKTVVMARSDGGNQGYADLAYWLTYNAALDATQSSNVTAWLNTKHHVYGYPVVTNQGPPWFASPTGKPYSDALGSIDSPWDIYTAFRDTADIQAGQTLYLRGGTYYGGYLSNYNSILDLTLLGTTNNPITIKPYNSERVIISIADDQTAQNGGQILQVDGTANYMQNLEFTNPSTNRFTWAKYAVGLTLLSSYNKLINCLVHDTGEGIWIGSAATNTEVYGCLVYNNGLQNLSSTNLDGSPRTPDSRGHGHGFYARSPNPYTVLADNIVFNQFGLGFQCYSTDSSVPLNGFRIEGNASFGNGRISASGDGERNFFVGGGGLVDNLLVYTNFDYAAKYSCGTGVMFGSGAGPGDTRVGEGTAVVVGNYFIGATYNYLNTFTNLVYTNNTHLGEDVDVNYGITSLVYSDPGATTLPAGSIYQWDWNRFYRSSTWTWPFRLSTNSATQYTFAQWKTQTGFDGNSTYSSTLPASPEVFVRPNKYDATKANVIVVNWPLNDNVTVDLSSVLVNGDRFQIRNGQDPFAASIVSGTYSGPISVPTTNLTVAIPVGEVSAPSSTSPQFVVFLADKLPPAATIRATLHNATLRNSSL